MELIEGIARGKDPADEVALKLVTVENQDGPEKLQKQYEYLLQIKQSAAVLGIVFDVEFAEPQTIHDRSITTDTGWKILLGRGLDIFQRMSDSPFNLAAKYQKYRELKGFGITYLRDSVRGAPSAVGRRFRAGQPALVKTQDDLLDHLRGEPVAGAKLVSGQPRGICRPCRRRERQSAREGTQLQGRRPSGSLRLPNEHARSRSWE